MENYLKNYDEVCSYVISSTIKIEGTVVLTPKNKQPFEIKAISIYLEGNSNQDYPLQKKETYF